MGNILRSFFLLSLLLGACSSDESNNTDRNENSEATYRVDFTTVWRATNFPVNFPNSAHFSGLVGATHNEQVKFWETGQLATMGLELVAETGSKGALRNEIEVAKTAGTAEFLLDGGGISSLSTKVSLEFDINNTYPLVTLISMLAPSPDWFVGVRDLNLFDSDANAWKQTVAVDLVLYDSGTDSGLQFTSSNANTFPAEIITRLTSHISDTNFVNGVHNLSALHLGTMLFTQLN